MSKVVMVVPAPEGLGTIGATVPPNTDVALNLRLESVVEGVLVSGTASARVEAECSRCLDPVAFSVTAELAELYVYPETDSKGRVKRREPEDPDWIDDEPTIEGDLLDLEPTLRDGVVLALPVAPICRIDCLGLCPECGFRLEGDPAHHHDQIDARWAALAQVLGSQHDDKEEG